jgi:hypothetical protein
MEHPNAVALALANPGLVNLVKGSGLPMAGTEEKRMIQSMRNTNALFHFKSIQIQSFIKTTSIGHDLISWVASKSFCEYHPPLLP